MRYFAFMRGNAFVRDDEKKLITMWHIEPLLGNDQGLSKYTTAVDK